MSNAARNLEDFYQAEQLAYAASDGATLDKAEADLVRVEKGRLAAIDAFTRYALGIADPIARWRALQNASVTLQAWMKDDSNNNRIFYDALNEKKRELKRTLRQSKRAGNQIEAKRLATILESIERIKSSSKPIIHKIIKANNIIETALKVAKSELPEDRPKRRPLTARKCDISFEDAAAEVMERTAVVREYLAR